MTDRTLLGRRTDGTYGLDISKAGFSVTSATQAQMAFSTRYAHAALIHQSGIVSSFTSGYADISFPALSYIPHGEVGFVEVSTGKYLGPFTDSLSSFPGCFMTTNLIRVYKAAFSSAYNVKYWVYKIPGA